MVQKRKWGLVKKKTKILKLSNLRTSQIAGFLFLSKKKTKRMPNLV